ncbi:hypothetical protein CBR_g45844 [Chara braunii]|uniref:Uncharacterized protein n=1 Tax=Chara braunii TaxID=69332 RepID=A0A388LZD4_CHABU|nr:hypothetical protein CBR_g45844 [Chara braunii]|eukprot:GBG87690.1 hypothetical protein CBR_g45844 [Chara braunii]
MGKEKSKGGKRQEGEKGEEVDASYTSRSNCLQLSSSALWALSSCLYRHYGHSPAVFIGIMDTVALEILKAVQI